MKLQVVGGSYKSESQEANYTQCLNMYVIDPGPGARNPGALVPFSGLYELVDLVGNECRGIITVGDYTYVVVDTRVYKLAINPAARTVSSTLLGTLGTFTGKVKMATNPTQIIIVDGSSSGYIITIATGALNVIADSDFLGGDAVVFCDTYFVYFEPNTAHLLSSDNNDGTTWNASDITTAQYKPDNLVGLALSRNEIWAIGQYSTEVFYDGAVSPGFPFIPRVGSAMDIGCGAPHSIVETDNAIIWLDNRGFIVRSQVSAIVRNQSTGYSLDVLSDMALQKEIATYGRVDDAVAIQYNENGHLMYQITFPSEHKTWVFDQATNLWFQRGTYSEYYGEVREHLAQFCTVVDHANIVCGVNSGKIYLMSSDFLDDNGIGITRKFVSSPISNEAKLLTVYKLELRIGTTRVAVGTTPKISLRYSNDGYHTWSHDLIRDIGATGNYGKPITWNRLGTSREWEFELTITEPIAFSIVEGTLEAESE